METHDREQIIQLGKALVAEEKLGYSDQAHEGGLEHFLDTWSTRAGSALQNPVVQESLALLRGYEIQPLNARRAMLTQALANLRSLFKNEKQTSSSVAAASPSKVAIAKPRISLANAKPLPPLALDSGIEEVPGVGRANATSFRRLGIRSVRDMLYHFPHRYDDFSSRKRIADLEIGADETVIVEVIDVRTFSMRSGGGALEVTVGDDSGTLRVTFFRQPWLSKQLYVGRKIVLSGKVTTYQGMRQMTSPKWEAYTEDELVHTGRLVPIHSLTKGLQERNARNIIKMVVDRAAPMLPDYLPPHVRERNKLLDLSTAIANMHFPDSRAMLERAKRRLGFDEFLFIQLGVMRRKLLWQGERGYAMTFNREVHQDLLSKLPYSLTGAQARALEEIFADMSRPVPMARLLQGDVGSGKTIVAAAALLQAVANGFQGALMAPTQILAEQHYNGLKKILGQVRVPRKSDDKPEDDGISAEERERLAEIKRILGMTAEDDMEGQGVRMALLTGNLGVRDRRRVLEGIANGEIDLVVGTHALITDNVRFQSLGLVCVDEQHRFGVEQRNRLKDKGFNPHLLSMTATPIPRTLTMTIYGDLDATVLDELPPGRQVIRTRWITSSERDKAYKHIRREVSKGRQAFVICPLVDESEKSDLPSAIQMQETLQTEVFPDLNIGLIHGQLLPKEKDEVMLAFRAGEYHILVATAVVEVGIDVPNATTILIEGAERFGLSQLHQFRGRVGRGSHQSYCILISDQENEVTAQRLEAMEQYTDGFKLAEIDLELRGPGEFLGRRQSGTPDLKVAQLADVHLLDAARQEAKRILEEDPELETPAYAELRKQIEDFWQTAAGAS